MVVDNLLDHGGVGQGAHVAEVVVLIGGNFPENTAHDFARSRLRQSGADLDLLRDGKPRYVLLDARLQLGDEVGLADVAGLGGLLEHDIGVDALALDIVRVADDSGLGDERMFVL